jgi:predicted ATPase
LPRHRTIHETIDWSYRLLSAPEQSLLRRLGIFGGSFSLDAAEAICGEDVLTLLSALVDKSLVLFENGRYRLLDTVRQFAEEKLAQSGEEEALREQHARWFVSLVESLEPRIFAGASDRGRCALDDQIGNIRAVFDRRRYRPSTSRVCAALVLVARLYFHEARRRSPGPRARRERRRDPSRSCYRVPDTLPSGRATSARSVR